jgi:hypothetical protein
MKKKTIYASFEEHCTFVVDAFSVQRDTTPHASKLRDVYFATLEKFFLEKKYTYATMRNWYVQMLEYRIYIQQHI